MGFTGHDGDDELGLINMRGRIYDPKLGRFLTTDPIVSRPHFGQSWNPYSYVHNSPLNFTDPSGFQDAPTHPEPPVDPEWERDSQVQKILAAGCRGAECQPRTPATSDATASKDAARDDTHSAANAARGDVQQPPGYDLAARARGFGQAVGGFFAGFALGSVPYAGVGAQLAFEAKLLDAGTREARIGLALGETVGGLFSALGGVGGEIVGGAASSTGIGAAVGVPVMAVSTVVVVGGLANAAAGVRGLSQVLFSKGAGGDRGGRGRFKSAEDDEEQLRAIEENKGRLTPSRNAEDGEKTRDAINSTKKSEQRFKNRLKRWNSDK